MSNLDFIEKISKVVDAENKKRCYPLFNSVIIAQACLETGYGKSSIMMKANALFGIKAFDSWHGKVYSSKTNEVYDNNPITITAKFRAYNNIVESVNDYLDLITKNERYRKAIVTDTPKDCITEIYKGGYATDPQYITKIMYIITLYNLTKYDNHDNNTPIFTIGQTYTTKVNLNVRKGASTSYKKCTYDELTPNAKEHAFTNGVLKAGTKVTCQDVIVCANDIWIKIPSGYIAAYYGGEWYVR